ITRATRLALWLSTEPKLRDLSERIRLFRQRLRKSASGNNTVVSETPPVDAEQDREELSVSQLALENHSRDMDEIDQPAGARLRKDPVRLHLDKVLELSQEMTQALSNGSAAKADQVTLDRITLNLRATLQSGLDEYRGWISDAIFELCSLAEHIRNQ